MAHSTKLSLIVQFNIILVTNNSTDLIWFCWLGPASSIEMQNEAIEEQNVAMRACCYFGTRPKSINL